MAKITKKTTLGELMEKYPETVEILLKNGLHCVGCHVSAYETIEQGILGHGMTEKELKKILEELNKKIEKK